MKTSDYTESSITDDIVATYGQCPRKAYYSLFFPETHRVKAITTFVNQRKKENEVSFIKRSASNSPFWSDQLSGKADIITDATLSYKDQTFENIHLRKINGPPPLDNFLYEPILFTADTAIKPHDRIRAAFCDIVLHGIQATSTGKSTVVLIDGSVRRVAIRREACVTKFYTLHISGSKMKSDTAIKYQKRLSKYKDRLFVFLECDNIPWNNNMAERALRHIAVQRKISGSFFSSSMQDYLVLLGVSQTCRFQNKQLLTFLMSGEKDIDLFRSKKDIKGWIMK